MSQFNFWAALLAAVTSFLLGGLWYSPKLFGNAWNREAGQAPQPGHPARVFGVSFAFSLIAALTFAWLLGPRPELGDALMKGALVGGCFVATSFGINYQFASRSTTMWLIDGGYHLGQFLLFGLVLGLWH
jgi:Protein of unknown function (DUF1761)